MSEFNKYEQLVEQIEQDVVGGPTDPMAGGSGEPTPGLEPAGTNETAAENVKYDKPYVDLAQIMYKALLQDYSDLSESRIERLGVTSPDDITTDEQAVAVIQRIEEAILDSQGIDAVASEGGEL